MQATQDHLQRIEAAERFVRHKLKQILSETSNVRVRLLAGNQAMVEVDADILPQVQESISGGGVWQDYFCAQLKFCVASGTSVQKWIRFQNSGIEYTNGKMTGHV